MILREMPAVRPGLCGALRIQFAGVTEVRCVPDGEFNAPLSARVAQTARQVSASGAALGVFLERDPSPGLLRMYLVASRADQAVLSVESIEAKPDRDIDRGLALKVLEVFNTLQETKDAGGAGALVGVLGGPVRGQAPTLPEGARGSGALRGFVEAGVGLRTGTTLTASVALSLGLSRQLERVRLDVVGGADMETPFEVRASSRHVRVVERGPTLAVRAVRSVGGVEFGGELHGRLAFVSAEGTALDGSRGERLLLLPYLGMGVDMRVSLTSRIWLRVAPTLDIALIHQRYEVDRITIVDAKILRLTLPLSVGFDGLL